MFRVILQHPVSWETVKSNLITYRSINYPFVSIPVYGDYWNGILLNNHHTLFTIMLHASFSYKELADLISANDIGKVKEIIQKFASEIKIFREHLDNDKFIEIRRIKPRKDLPYEKIGEKILKFGEKNGFNLDLASFLKDDVKIPIVENDKMVKDYVIQLRKTVPELYMIQEELYNEPYKNSRIRKEIYENLQKNGEITLIKYEALNYTHPEEGWVVQKKNNILILKRYYDTTFTQESVLPNTFEEFENFIIKNRIVNWR